VSAVVQTVAPAGDRGGPASSLRSHPWPAYPLPRPPLVAPTQAPSSASSPAHAPSRQRPAPSARKRAVPPAASVPPLDRGPSPGRQAPGWPSTSRWLRSAVGAADPHPVARPKGYHPAVGNARTSRYAVACGDPGLPDGDAEDQRSGDGMGPERLSCPGESAFSAGSELAEDGFSRQSCLRCATGQGYPAQIWAVGPACFLIWREGPGNDRVLPDLDQRLGVAAKPIATRWCLACGRTGCVRGCPRR
jgi:hypothetical protein